jgi:1-acyl-sn-glycerol-3-phosphate acyltransferase
MNKFIEKIYLVWVWTCFALVLICFYIPFWISVQKESWKKYGHLLNKIWGHLIFMSCFLRTKIEWRFKVDKKKQYIYCANHTSYLDIPTMCFSLPGYTVFIGKSSLGKVPLFGYMFRNLYVSVDRKSPKSKYETVVQSMQKIDLGYNLAIFPEGTISKHHAPVLMDFKDGAFRIAIEKQVAIVPMTIVNNWKILPDDGNYVPRGGLVKAIVHEPIETIGLTLDDVDMLKNKTKQIIANELRKYFPKEYNEAGV